VLGEPQHRGGGTSLGAVTVLFAEVCEGLLRALEVT
jgi:hypothetical protein